MLLRCVDDDEAVKIQNEAYNIACEGHVNGQILAKKITRMDYCWPMIERDRIELVRSCHSCQLYANKIHIRASLLHPLMAILHVTPDSYRPTKFTYLFILATDVLTKIISSAYENGFIQMVGHGARGSQFYSMLMILSSLRLLMHAPCRI